MNNFIRLEYEKHLRSGEDSDRATLYRDFRLEANKLTAERLNKSLFQADDEEYEAVFNELMSSGKYDKLQAYADEELQAYDESLQSANGREAACSRWYRTGTIANGSRGVVNWPIYYIGLRNICKPDGVCQKDCDFHFRSKYYNQYYYSSYLWGSAQALKALRYDGAKSHASRRVAPNRTEEYLEVTIGARRIRLFFLRRGPAQFAKEVQVKLNVRR